MKRNEHLLWWTIIWCVSVAMLAGCAGNYSPVEGDLVFVAEGESDFSGAISQATADSGSVSYVHVGIVDVESDGAVFVIEASDRSGVCMSPWEEFLSRAPQVGGRPGVTVMRVSDGAPPVPDGRMEEGTTGAARFNARECVERAKGFIGQPYDWYYLPDNGRMYCSELVWESYLREDGSRIFSAAPMNFRAPDGSMPDFWTRLYATLGVPVPEGVLGTNPNAMASDAALQEVYRFFK